MRVGIGQAESLDSRDAMRRALAMAAGGLAGAAPDAALVFAHVDADHAALLGAFAETHDGTPLIGCSTAGEYCSAGGFSEDSVVVALLQSDGARFATGIGYGASDVPDRAARDAVARAEKKLGGPARLCLFFPDGRSGGTDQVVTALGGALPADCPVFGAAAGRIGTSDKAPVQLHGAEIVNDAVPVLLIGGGIECAFGVSNSWHPVGKETVAEGVDGNCVARIGGRPALEFYRHYLGPHAKPASEFPLAVHDAETDKFFLRVPTGYDEENGTVSFGAGVPDGATVRLSEATPARILAETERSIREAFESFDGTPALALAFSCNARKGILGTGVAGEPEVLTRHLADGAAAVGFYGFAEISPLVDGGARPKLHHGTLVTVLLGDGTPATRARAGTSAVNGKVPDSPDILRRKLERSEYYRRDLEQIRDVNAALLRTVSKEIEDLHAALEKEQEKSERLLRNILPGEVADELKERGAVEPVYYASASVLFTDFVGFTTRAAKLSPTQLVSELNTYFTAFDDITARHGLEKLKTIGDAYMCVGGVPHVSDSHVPDMVEAAIEMQAFMAGTGGTDPWQLRIGIHAGPLMAGVIGSTKFAYDVWGDTVNIAARLESAGAAGKVNVSQAVVEAVPDRFNFTHRGKIAAKNVGDIDMYFVERK